MYSYWVRYRSIVVYLPAPVGADRWSFHVVIDGAARSYLITEKRRHFEARMEVIDETTVGTVFHRKSRSADDLSVLFRKAIDQVVSMGLAA